MTIIIYVILYLVAVKARLNICRAAKTGDEMMEEE